MVNIELYRTFIAIYRVGTISKAAVLCDITQPAASQQLASLEKSLKVKLFERTPRAMVPSNEGHELYTKVSDSFDWLDFVSQDFILLRQEEEALLHVGVLRSFYTAVLAQKVIDLPFRLEVHFDEHIYLLEKLKKGKIDLLVSDEKLSQLGMYSEKIMHQQFVLVGHSSVSLPEEGFKHWQSIRAWVGKQNWLSYDAELSLIRRYFKAQYDLQPNIKPKCIVPDFHAIVGMLCSVESVAVLPLYMCKEALATKKIQELHRFNIDDDSHFYLSYEGSSKNNVLVKKFRELLV